MGRGQEQFRDDHAEVRVWDGHPHEHGCGRDQVNLVGGARGILLLPGIKDGSLGVYQQTSICLQLTFSPMVTSLCHAMVS